MVIEIREERPADVDAIGRVNSLAFGREEEGQLVDVLRARAAVLLSLVAVAGDTIVGHVLFSPATIAGVDGAALGPMAVAPAYQRHGIGSRLVRAGLDRLRSQACPFAVVLGYPDFYPRFGFAPASHLGLTCQWDVPPEVFMIAVLEDAVSGRLHGHVAYRPEFSAFG